MANYNTTLQTNNTDLQAILNKVNALPEAGSGGSGGTTVETCTGTIRSYNIPNPNSVWFLNSNMQPESLTPSAKSVTTFTAVKGSFVYIYGTVTPTSSDLKLNGATLLYSQNYHIVVSIDSDGFSIVT